MSIILGKVLFPYTSYSISKYKIKLKSWRLSFLFSFELAHTQVYGNNPRTRTKAE